MGKIIQLISLFVAAVVVGLLIHPLMSIAFLLLAKIISLFWEDARAGYREAFATKRKRHLLTDEGDVLEIIAEEDAPAAYEERS
jgi:uncharacterized membrane protein YbhN (UPF0104 family)